jgi:DNA-directed RNA polymerase sigma subunit (sigma70/sigma32)
MPREDVFEIIEASPITEQKRRKKGEQCKSRELRAELCLPTPVSTPLDQVLGDEKTQLVRDAIEILNPVNASMIRKRFGIGGQPSRTLEEIASEAGISPQAVDQRIKSSLRRIRGRLRIFENVKNKE